VYSNFSFVIGFEIITPTGGKCQNCYAVRIIAEFLIVSFAVGRYEVSNDT
jgi:hypothetical protein